MIKIKKDKKYTIVMNTHQIEYESSDDETADTRTLQSSLSFTIMHGKSFRGKALRDVVATKRGREYMRWSLEKFDGLHTSSRFHIEAVLALYTKVKAQKKPEKESVVSE